MQSENKLIRLDKWLWAARFYKTRALSSKGVAAGKVLLNGSKTKASKIVKINDKLQIKKAKLSWTIIVLALSSKRKSATIAKSLYAETSSSLLSRKKMISSKIKNVTDSGGARPTKRDRRLIDSITKSL